MRFIEIAVLSLVTCHCLAVIDRKPDANNEVPRALLGEICKIEITDTDDEFKPENPKILVKKGKDPNHLSVLNMHGENDQGEHGENDQGEKGTGINKEPEDLFPNTQPDIDTHSYDPAKNRNVTVTQVAGSIIVKLTEGIKK